MKPRCVCGHAIGAHGGTSTATFGHLSNLDVAEYLRTTFSLSARHLIVGHLSGANNSPDLVTEIMGESLRSRGSKAALTLARQNHRTEIITV